VLIFPFIWTFGIRILVIFEPPYLASTLYAIQIFNTVISSNKEIVLVHHIVKTFDIPTSSWFLESA
jgi:hypothetical protein